MVIFGIIIAINKVMALKAFKYRIYPNANQSILIDKHIGCARFVYNLALATKLSAYEGNKKILSCFDLINQLPDLKKDCEWLKEVNSQTLQMSIKNLDNSFKNFFEGNAGFPIFKKKVNSKQSFNVPQRITVNFDESRIYIPKFSEGIKVKFHRKFKGCIKNITIRKKPAGKYEVSILVDTYEHKINQNKFV